MKIILLPYSTKNPYQEQLVEGLTDRGHDVFTTSETYGSLIKEILRNGLFDVIHLHWISPIIQGKYISTTILRSVTFFLILKLLNITGVKIVWTIHNLTGHDSDREGFEIAFYRYFFFHVVDDAIVHSNHSKQEVIHEYDVQERANRIQVVKHGNYCEYYQNDVTQTVAREELGLPTDAFVFLYFGQIKTYKNVPVLIKNFSALEQKDARLIIAGNPSSQDLREKIKALCRDEPRIQHSLRFIPDDKVQIFMNAADVVTLPYDEILTSGTAILAMSFEKPIIAPNKGCLSEIVPDESNFLYDSDEIGIDDELRNAIVERQKLGDYGKRNFREATKWDWKRVTASTERVYSPSCE
jgi:glycosyltransferase involved in cell wall biosynthesis